MTIWIISFQFYLFIQETSISWDQIDSKLRAQETVEERKVFDQIATGRGFSNHKANIRLFDSPEGYIPEVTLYRDTAGSFYISTALLDIIYLRSVQENVDAIIVTYL